MERYGGDTAIETLKALGIKYVALNPGASFRGLHASLASDDGLTPILALHENVAVGIAHGYAKSSGHPMAVFLHDIVGLQSGTMGIFNAWADQVPMVVVGGSGPADTNTRRPWIDWIHSCRMQGLLVRDYVKWDDEPASITDVSRSIARAYSTAISTPQGPTYVAFDADLQEAQLSSDEWAEVESILDALRSNPPAPTRPTVDGSIVRGVAEQLAAAKRPVILADGVGRSDSAYAALIAIAERLQVPVVDLGGRHNFPTLSPLNASKRREELLAQADYVLCLDVRDPNFAISATQHQPRGYTRLVREGVPVVCVSLNQFLNRGFLDYAPFVPDIVEYCADNGVFLPALDAVLAEIVGQRDAGGSSPAADESATPLGAGDPKPAGDDGPLTKTAVHRIVHSHVSSGPWELANVGLGGPGVDTWTFDRFNAHLGKNIGGGLGYGIGVSIGAALAHKDDDTLVVNMQTDGDLMYTASGLWSAVRYQLPILTVMLNNRTYGQDLMHQSEVGKSRGLSYDLARIGIDIDDPVIDFSMLARAQGMQGLGPVKTRAELDEALTVAVNIIRTERRPVLVDVWID